MTSDDEFQTKIMDTAKGEYAAMLDYIAARSSRGATAWADAFDQALRKLKSNPLKCPLAPESADHARELRQFLFKTRKGQTYRGIFTVEDQLVYILHLRGPGQDLIEPHELELPDA